MSDYIKREAALEGIVKLKDGIQMSNMNEYLRGYNNGLVMGCSVVAKQPSADVAPVVHGRWITKDIGFLRKSFICSVCGGWEHALWHEHQKMNYCPNCGARMDAEVEE